jgi:hypothetical protein
MPAGSYTPRFSPVARAARRVLGLVATTLALAALATSAAQAAPAEYEGSSEDGSKVFFSTTAKLVPGDTDNGFRDVYERFFDTELSEPTFVTREISTGPTGGNDSYNASFDGVSIDGAKVFFSTDESLVKEDTDHTTDVYMRNTTTGETTLVSRGAASCAPEGCGDRAFPATFVGATPSGSRAFFTSEEKLAEGDGDEASDVFSRVTSIGGETTLVSRPDPSCSTCTGAALVTFRGASADGTKVTFETAGDFANGDGDGETDIYARDTTGGTTKLVSAVGTCPPPLAVAECAPIYRATASGGAVFFQTKERLSLADHDSSQDVYEWPTGGTPVLLSTSPEGEEGGGAHDSLFAGVSADGSAAFFTTEEKLSSADTDEAIDVYERSGGTTELISGGGGEVPAEFDFASPSGSVVVFSTAEALGGGDSGTKMDVYERSGGTTTLVSPGSSEFGAFFAGASSAASRVFYTTSQKIASDSDEKPDIYEWSGGGTPALISSGPTGGNGADTPHLSAVSSNGARAFFTSKERLTEGDNFSGEQDVYEHSSTGTQLVSTVNSSELQLGPQAPGLTGTSPATVGETTEPLVLGEAEPNTSIKIYATPDCSKAPVGTGSAAELLGAGIKVTAKAGATTTFHATATNGSGDTSACSTSAVSYRQESAPPSVEGGGSGGGGSDGGSGGSGGSTGGGSTGGGSGGSAGGSAGRIEIGGIVYVVPQTRITFGPASKTRSRRVVFRFLDATEQPGSKFVCKLDRHAWKGCNSPFGSGRLKPGRHVFAVKGESAAGQWEQLPIKRRFKVVGR